MVIFWFKNDFPATFMSKLDFNICELGKIGLFLE